MNQDIQETLDAIGEDHPLMKQLLRDVLKTLSKRDWMPTNLGTESQVQNPSPTH